jgi:hypothetical protein
MPFAAAMRPYVWREREMRIKAILWSTCLSAAMALMTLPAGAAENVVAHHKCVAGPATAASYTWNFRQEADNLFQGIEFDARQAATHSAKLESFEDSPTMTWESHADQLMQVRAKVNDMGAKLCRLETIRQTLAPWQQHTVDRMAKRIVLIADNTGDAIHFLNGHHEELWLPMYRTYVTNLYNQNHALTESAGEAVQYASVRHEFRNLRHDLGARASS